LKLFSDLGITCISQGTYNDPKNLGADAARPTLDLPYFPDLNPLAKLDWVEHVDVIPEKLIDWCDVIYILGISKWLPVNWDGIRHKKVVWRSIGQSDKATEELLTRYVKDGLRVVRYSPMEEIIPSYAGADSVIRFYKDETEYKGWNGQRNEVVTVAQSMKARDDYLRFRVFETATRGLPRRLYGKNNSDAGLLWGGQLSYEELKQVYRDNRVFFYTCTRPAPYTMGFMEAWMCFPGDVKVSTDGALRAYHRPFTGQLVDIETERGFRVTATPEHPFLTPDGWTEARHINDGSVLYAASDGWHQDVDERAISDIVSEVHDGLGGDCRAPYGAHQARSSSEDERPRLEEAVQDHPPNEGHPALRTKPRLLGGSDRRGGYRDNTQVVWPQDQDQVLRPRLHLEHIHASPYAPQGHDTSFGYLPRRTTQQQGWPSGPQGSHLLQALQAARTSSGGQEDADERPLALDRESPGELDLRRLLGARDGTRSGYTMVEPERVSKVSTRPAPPGTLVYNIGTRTGTYVANGIFVHNSGIPVVAIGAALAGFYVETPWLIENGTSGIVADSIYELHEWCRVLLEDEKKARRIGEAGRNAAIRNFGYPKIKEQWRRFFDSL